MAAGARARRRAEAEQVAVRAAAARVAAQRRAVRRTASRERLTARVPRRHPGPSGTLAARRRNQVRLTLALIVALDVVVFLLSDDWSVRALVLIVGLLAAPVLHTVLFRKA